MRPYLVSSAILHQKCASSQQNQSKCAQLPERIQPIGRFCGGDQLDGVAKLHHRVGMTRKQSGLLKFLESTTGRAMSRMATDIGMVPSTLTRQFKAGTVPVIEIVKICREYGVDLLDAFVAADFITRAEADSLCSKGALSGATDAELTSEILRRLEVGSATRVLTDQIGDDADGVNGPAADSGLLLQGAQAADRAAS